MGIRGFTLTLMLFSAWKTKGVSIQSTSSEASTDAFQNCDDCIQGEVDDLINRMEKMEKENEIMKSRLSELESRNKESEWQLQQLNSLSSQSTRNVTIGFSAVASTGTEYGENAIILFPTVRMDTGDNYNELTSIFTCSVDGIYYFSVNLAVHTGFSAGYTPRVMMTLDNTELVGLYVDTLDGDRVMMSNSVLTDCGPYQQVSVKTVDSTVYVYSAYSSSSFSGFYLGV